MPSDEAAVDRRVAAAAIAPRPDGRAVEAVLAPAAAIVGGSPPWVVAALVAANAMPLLGVLWWGWSTFDLLLLYWFETGVIGLFTLVQLFRTEDSDPHRRRGLRGSLAKLYSVGGVAVFYGFLWWALGSSVVEVFGPGGAFGTAPDALATALPSGPFAYFFGGEPSVDRLLEGGLQLSALGLLVSHGLSFVGNAVLRGEDLRTAPSILVWRPYGRVVVLHVTLMFGALFVTAIGEPLVGLASFVVLKTGVDLNAHLRAHRNRPAVR